MSIPCNIPISFSISHNSLCNIPKKILRSWKSSLLKKPSVLSTIGWQGPCVNFWSNFKKPMWASMGPGVPTKLRSFFRTRFWYGSFNNFRPRETYTRHEQQTSFWYIYSICKRPVSSENSLPSPLWLYVTITIVFWDSLALQSTCPPLPQRRTSKGEGSQGVLPFVSFGWKIWLNTTFEKYIYIYNLL